MKGDLQMRIEKFFSDGTDGRPCGLAFYRLSCDGELVGEFASISKASDEMERIARSGLRQNATT